MIVDFHTHIFPEWLIERREEYLTRDATFGELFSDPKAKLATAEELVEAMDRDGVHRAVAMGMGWTDTGLAREVNDYIIDAVTRFPDRLTGFAGVSPAWGSLAAEEAERCSLVAYRVTPDELEPTAKALAQRLAEKSPPAMAMTKQLLRHSHEAIKTQIEKESVLFAERMFSEDTRERFSKFLKGS